MYNKKTCCKVMPAIFIGIALILAIIVSFWRQGGLPIAVSISRFFEVMLPTLGAGALIKFIVGCNSCAGCKCDDDCCCRQDNEEKTCGCNIEERK